MDADNVEGAGKFFWQSTQPFWLCSTDNLSFVVAGGFCKLSIFHDVPSNFSAIHAVVPGEG